MKTVSHCSPVKPENNLRAQDPKIFLLGTGGVGRAFVERHQRVGGGRLQVPVIAAIANTRGMQPCEGDPNSALDRLNSLPRREKLGFDGADLRAGDLLVDATACGDVASRHAEFLARNIHVVTANKMAVGGSLAEARKLFQARRDSGAFYGDSATVGAGLPILSSLRSLVDGGDEIISVEGVLSGALAWLFDQYDGSAPFSEMVRRSQEAGYTEPDPRVDLSGEDVHRKLLILARAAGIQLDRSDIKVGSLVPATLASAGMQDLGEALRELDEPMLNRYRAAKAAGRRLRFVGRFDADGGAVALHELDPNHPLCVGSGTDNRVAITSCRYRDRPLVIQGVGAGVEVTAAALLDDILQALRAQRQARA